MQANQATLCKESNVKLDPAINPPTKGPIVKPSPKATPNIPIPLALFFSSVISAM